MKSTWKHTIFGVAVGLSSIVDLSAYAQDKPPAAAARLLGAPVSVQSADSAASPELMKPAEAMVLALNQKEVDKAFPIMTDKGAEQYVGMMLMQTNSSK